MVCNIPDGRNGTGIPEVGADEFAPADHGHGRGRTGQLSRRPVTPQLLVRLQWQDKKDRVLFSTSKLTNGRMTFKRASNKTGIGIKTAHYCFGNSDSTRETRGGFLHSFFLQMAVFWTASYELHEDYTKNSLSEFAHISEFRLIQYSFATFESEAQHRGQQTRAKFNLPSVQVSVATVCHYCH